MDSFITLAGAGWPQPLPSSPPNRSLGHFRSLSSVASSPTLRRPRSSMLASGKSPSTSQLPTITAFEAPEFSDEMSTLPDPRSRAMSTAEESNAPTPSRHPDLNDEVATLSTKLINAINHQTHLDDTLSATRHELETARERIRDLEVQNASQREMLAGDVWIRKQSAEADKKVLHAKIAEEKQKRIDTEKEKKKIEQELENLTAALFEEANKMVIGAKEEAAADHDVLQRKNDQLKSQLADCESLLKSQQEQLSELKHVLENMASERDDQTNVTAPSSPGFTKSDIRDYEPSSTDGANTSPLIATVAPSHPTSFPHLVQPVLRTDLSSYDDFVNLARLSRTRSCSRVSSGSIGGLSALTLGLGGSTSSAHPSNASTSSLTTSAPTTSSAPQSPNTPASAISTNSATSTAPLPSLKETKFFKRVLAEDIEPTLRLDMAPGLSWLARRSVLNSMTEGSLVVEPVPMNSPYIAIAKPQHYPCSLCGDNRRTTTYLRTHRFRTSEADSAQRYPLCPYCLNRVRSTCDFLGFLRMVKDGHWRADDEDQEKAAWEESVRLRDQMFWARIGGGVVPINPLHACPEEMEKSPRPSQESSVFPKDLNVEKTRTVTRDGSPVDRQRGRPENANAATEEPHTPPEQSEGTKSVRDSAYSLEAKSIAGSEETKRLSITIPSTE